MAEEIQLAAQKRDVLGTRPCRRLRRTGFIPAVLTEKHKESINLVVNRVDFERMLTKGARLINLKHPAGSDKVLIKEVQWDHLDEHVLHVDFNKIDIHERITIEVNMVLRGKPVGVAEEGGVLDQYMRTLKVSCVPTEIPDKIEIDVTSLKKDQPFYVKNAKIPANLRVLSDPDAVIAMVTEHKIEEVLTAAAATPGPTEPELIRKEPKEGEEEEEKPVAEKKEAAPKKEKEEKK